MFVKHLLYLSCFRLADWCRTYYIKSTPSGEGEDKLYDNSRFMSFHFENVILLVSSKQQPKRGLVKLNCKTPIDFNAPGCKYLIRLREICRHMESKPAFNIETAGCIRL